jgi:hypothetical protein
MDKRVEQWCSDHYAALLQPYQSALRPVRVQCHLCSAERTERASVLVEQPGCPACPRWTLERDGWVIERPYDMDGVLFLYGLDVEGTAVVLDAASSDERRAYVERNGFRYVPVHSGMSVDDVRALCLGTPAPAPSEPPVLPAPVPAVSSVDHFQVTGQLVTRPRYGWRWVGPLRPLEQEPTEQATIAWLRAERAAHPALTVHALCARLEQHPEFPRRGAKRWHPTAVQRILEYNGIPVRPNYYTD